ncbi:hypothetical protein J5Y04_28630 [Kitasatospora sp. RG8]|uniref:hypothetical protein n=1 Tax=Kitasatospora sp. RG8 TaxID=2820815 RepID=UPI001ADF78B6|nr:hypothetical protein [Kitasatospora sp. RG8]MBP0453480.1 hypothetical protein [Kitasatospora sp. RG8]
MPEHERQETFDGAAIAKALHADATAVTDPAFGKGQHFQVERDKTFLSLDTFPEAGVSRITTNGARIEPFGGMPPTVEEEGVVFLQKDADHEHVSLALHPDGAITMGYQVDTGPASVAGIPRDPALRGRGLPRSRLPITTTARFALLMPALTSYSRS